MTQDELDRYRLMREKRNQRFAHKIKTEIDIKSAIEGCAVNVTGTTEAEQDASVHAGVAASSEAQLSQLMADGEKAISDARKESPGGGESR